MYSELNTIIRTKINSLVATYSEDTLPIYHFGDQTEDIEGAHIMCSYHTNEPNSEEVGFSTSQQLTGYIMVGVLLPTADNALAYASSLISSQIYNHFQRSAEVTGNIKFEILSVTKNDPIRDGGFFVQNCVVNFRAFYVI